MKTVIYLIRHGESISNVDKTFTGQLDLPLSELGKFQANCLRAYFKDIKIDKIFASDLCRAYDTITPVAKDKGVEIEKTKALREIYGGKWENEKFVDLMGKYLDTYSVWRYDIFNAVCDGGESVSQLGERVFDFIKEKVEGNLGKVLVFATHATPIRTFNGKVYALNGQDKKLADWVPNCSVTKVVYDRQKFTLEVIGDTSHLDGKITKLPNNV